jgi:hypothetical protein
VQVTEVASKDSILTTLGPVTGSSPALSIDGLDRFLVTYQRFDAATGHDDIFSRRDLPEGWQRVSLNPQDTNNDYPAVASSADGNSVVVWVNAYLPTDHDIWAQRLDKYGRPAGKPIEVDFTNADSYDPHVAMDAQGRFVVTWEDVNPDGTGSIQMRYFSASGAPLTQITQVTPSGESDFNPSVAASNGSFVIAWTSWFSATDTSISYERFTVANNVPTGTGIATVNGGANEDFACVAMAPNGAFDIAYQFEYQTSPALYGILAYQFDSSGTALFAYNLGGGGPPLSSLIDPAIAMDNAGNAVITYGGFNGTNYGIYAARLGADGTLDVITVYAVAGVDAYISSVALEPTGGQYVVAYQTLNDAASVTGVGVTEVGSDDTLVDATWVGGAGDPSVSIDGFDRYTVTYTLLDPSDGHQDIFSNRYFLS